MVEQIARIPLFPPGSSTNKQGHLEIGGCDVTKLTAEYGTPLYLFDEPALRNKCAELKDEFNKRYSGTTVIYACKAVINKALATIFQEEGLGLDVVSGGELGIAHSARFPLEKVYFHGNNKSAEELKLGLEWGIGRVVVDNFHELEMLGKLAKEKGRRQDILLRLTPGVDVHTHQYTITGNLDSKFGFPLAKGEEAVVKAMSTSGLNLLGLHFHIGSLIFETEPYLKAMEIVLDFAGEMKHKHGFEMKELDVGGGFGVQYTLDSPDVPISVFAEAITSGIIDKCRKLGLPQPKLVIEPGRSIVARAGVAVYTVGAIKDIPGVRCYVSVDGGMADNIRPALYAAKLEAVVANNMKGKMAGKVTIAGKFCESGDILIRDIEMPAISSGDILAVAGCGAYCIPESMNYNAFFKPPVILVKGGKSRLIRRRETLEDLTRCDL